MTRILFLDDDKPLVKSLRRSMKLMRPRWECFYFVKAADALEFLNADSVDVIVSDIRMPGMDGVEFLSRIKKHFPSPVRIILSGHMGEHESLRSMNVAHHFLAKPCEIETLIAIIERLVNFRTIFTDESLLGLVNGIDSLPVLPDVYLEVSRAVDDPNSSLQDIGEVISRDPGMSTSILKAVNSPFFGIRRTVDDVAQATRMLGMETLRGLVLCEGIFRQFQTSPEEDFSLKLLWEHSLRVSNMVRSLALHEGLGARERDLASLAGLLHDLGKLVLLDQLPKEYGRVLDAVRTEQVTPVQVEIRTFGTSHAKLGAYLLGLWGCAEPVVFSIAFHHQPLACEEEHTTILALLHAANAFDHALYRIKNQSYDRLHDEAFLTSAGYGDKIDEWMDICRETLE